MSEFEKNIVAEAAALGAMIGEPKQAGGADFTVIPNSMKFVDLERYRSYPARVKRNTVLDTVESFMDYIDEFVGNRTKIYFNRNALTFRAVFDSHTLGQPSWGDHLATFKLTISRQWKTWLERAKKPMEPSTFAEFIEENAIDVLTPTSADLMELLLNFDVTSTVNFGSVSRIGKGLISLQYTEEVKQGARTNQIEIPEKFELYIPVVEGGPRLKVTLRFHFKLKEGALSVWYDVVQKEQIQEEAVNQTILTIRTRFPETPFFFGSIPEPQ